MIHLKLTCDTRRQKKDKTHPIVFRISLKGNTRDIATGFSCKIELWDSKKNTLKPKTEELKIIQSRIKDQELSLLERIREFEYEFPDATSIQAVKQYLQVGAGLKASTVEGFWNDEIKRQTKSGRHGNVRSYTCAMGGLKRHANLNIPFSSIDYAWLVEVETSLRSSGASLNTVSMYLRALRSIYNKAINHGIADFKDYPFRRYKIKSGKSSPRVASIEELQRFFELNVSTDDPAYDHWNYGRLIFLLRGINFADLALLTQDNLKKGRLIYSRRKTHKSYSVELLPLAKQIFDSYRDDTRRTLLPIIREEELVVAHNLPDRISQQRKTTNKWLSRIGAELGIEEKLSTYVFRYSHANACKKLGYSKDLISESLGHGYGLAVSSAYLENYDIELVDEMNADVYAKIVRATS